MNWPCKLSDKFEAEMKYRRKEYELKAVEKTKNLLNRAQKKLRRKLSLCGINGDHWLALDGQNCRALSEPCSFQALDWGKVGHKIPPEPTPNDNYNRMARLVYRTFPELIELWCLIYRWDEHDFAPFGQIESDVEPRKRKKTKA